MSTFIIGYVSFLTFSWCWCLYELAHAPTDKELWKDEIDS